MIPGATAIVWILGLFTKLLKKLWVPLVLFISIIPGILGTYSYLRGEGVEWFLAVPASLGIEFGGQIPTLVNSAQYLTDPTVPVLPLIVAAFLGFLDVYWAWYLWKLFFRYNEENVSQSTVILFFTGALVAGLLFTLAVDLYVLPAENLRVSGLTYFLENPGQAVDPVTQFVGERAAEDSLLNESVNNTNMTS